MNPYGLYLTPESRVIVLGLPRYGKTRLVRDRLTADCTRVIFHDVTGHDYYASGRLPLSIDELERHSYLLNDEFVRIVVIARNAGDPEILRDESARIIDLIFPRPGHIVAVFDELQAHHRKSEKIFNSLFARGNHFGIVPILCSQKATDIGLGARVTASDVYCLGQHHPIELKAVYDCYGDIYAGQVAASHKGDNPIHWHESERERWWSEKARYKFKQVIQENAASAA